MSGQRVGPYEILSPLGSGGMATVYLGRAIGPDGQEQLVALKMMHPEIAEDPEFRAMFLDEARVAASIHHPNVVSTLAVLEHESHICMVMDYVQGATLHELVHCLWEEEGALVPLAAAVSILLDLLAGLHAAHELRAPDGSPLNVVHRDVCPQNVLVGTNGVARISDFGVARAEMRLAATPDGKIKGKLAYMEPERMRGGPVDRRCDIYSAGVVLWELLTGRALVQGDLFTISQAVLRGTHASPRQINGAVPKLVDEVCMFALRARAQRYATAEQFAMALADAAMRSTIAPATRPTLGELAQHAAQSRRQLPP